MIPTFAEAFIFIKIVEVDMTTLASMIARLGRRRLAGRRRRLPLAAAPIQRGMGVLLLVGRRDHGGARDRASPGRRRRRWGFRAARLAIGRSPGTSCWAPS